MMLKISVAIKKNIFTGHSQTAMIQILKYIYKCVFIYNQLVKIIDLFQYNPAEKFSVP